MCVGRNGWHQVYTVAANIPHSGHIPQAFWEGCSLTLIRTDAHVSVRGTCSNDLFSELLQCMCVLGLLIQKFPQGNAFYLFSLSGRRKTMKITLVKEIFLLINLKQCFQKTEEWHGVICFCIALCSTPPNTASFISSLSSSIWYFKPIKHPSNSKSETQNSSSKNFYILHIKIAPYNYITI